jgi:ECF transporter S component (folate family)
MNKTRKIALCALLLASMIVLSRFLSIRTPIVSIGFVFVPHILTAILLGPRYSVALAALADIIGALLFPSGAFYFGFTLSAIASGLIYGLLLYRKGKFKVDKRFLWRRARACLLVTLLVNGVMNTLWVIALTKNAAAVVVPVRIAKQLVMLPIQVLTMWLLCKTMEKQINNLKTGRAATVHGEAKAEKSESKNDSTDQD